MLLFLKVVLFYIPAYTFAVILACLGAYIILSMIFYTWAGIAYILLGTIGVVYPPAIRWAQNLEPILRSKRRSPSQKG